MGSNELIVILIVGAICGYLAGFVRKGSGFGLAWNIIIGICGGLFGYWLFGALGVSLGRDLLGNIITGVIGAVILLFIAEAVRRRPL